MNAGLLLHAALRGGHVPLCVEDGSEAENTVALCVAFPCRRLSALPGSHALQRDNHSLPVARPLEINSVFIQ